MLPGSIDHYADINGIRLHYVSAGNGPLMLFVHGFPEFWYAWRAQLPEFARDHQVVAPDLRGFNLSDKPAEVKAYRPAVLVEDLRQLILHLGHSRCVLVAHDWGGAVAWNFAAQHPEMVEKLVIINAPHPVTFARELCHNPAQQAASQYMLLFRSDKAEAVMRADNFRRLEGMIVDWRGGDGAHFFDEATRTHYHEAWSQPGALSGGLNYYRASPMHPPTADSPGPAALALNREAFTVSRPTLVIWGERDHALLPALLDGLDELVTDLRIERIAEGSHWVVHEFPDRVNALIRGFIETPQAQ